MGIKLKIELARLLPMVLGTDATAEEEYTRIFTSNYGQYVFCSAIPCKETVLFTLHGPLMAELSL